MQQPFPYQLYWQVGLVSLLGGIGWKAGEEAVVLLLPWLVGADGASRQAALLLLLLAAGAIAVVLFGSRGPRSRRLTQLSNSSNSRNSSKSKAPAPASTHRLEAEFLSAGAERPFSAAVTARLEAHSLLASPSVTAEDFYAAVHGKCCESVIGTVQLPVGLVGPIRLNDSSSEQNVRFLPLATVEGALVASVNRGCKAMMMPGARVSACITGTVGMTRGPCIEAPSIEEARDWLADFTDPARLDHWRGIFDQSSPGGHVHLREIRGRQVGRLVFLRFRADCEAAMGMNMMSRGCEYFLSRALPPGTKYCLSGNFCTDKKPSAVNWLEGRGRSVVVEATIPTDVLSRVFKIRGEDVTAFCRFAQQKNLIGSAAAGSVGGFNAHVANTVAAAYLATGQDVAQVVDAAAALTQFDVDDDGGGLRATLTLPCIEVGFLGGGTGLPQQKHYLHVISRCRGPDELARCIGIAALGGEVSLMAALWNRGELVSAHARLNK